MAVVPARTPSLKRLWSQVPAAILASCMRIIPLQEVNFMNADTFKGGWKEFKGELKKKWGQLTDNDLMEAEGDYDKFMGVVQKRYGDQKEEIERWTEDWYS